MGDSSPPPYLITPGRAAPPNRTGYPSSIGSQPNTSLRADHLQSSIYSSRSHSPTPFSSHGTPHSSSPLIQGNNIFQNNVAPAMIQYTQSPFGAVVPGPPVLSKTAFSSHQSAQGTHRNQEEQRYTPEQVHGYPAGHSANRQMVSTPSHETPPPSHPHLYGSAFNRPASPDPPSPNEFFYSIAAKGTHVQDTSKENSADSVPQNSIKEESKEPTEATLKVSKATYNLIEEAEMVEWTKAHGGGNPSPRRYRIKTDGERKNEPPSTRKDRVHKARKVANEKEKKEKESQKENARKAKLATATEEDIKKKKAKTEAKEEAQDEPRGGGSHSDTEGEEEKDGDRWTDEERDTLLRWYCIPENYDACRNDQKKGYKKAEELLGGRRLTSAIKGQIKRCFDLYQSIKRAENHTGGGDGDRLEEGIGAISSSGKPIKIKTVEAFKNAGYFDLFDACCSKKPNVAKLIDLSSSKKRAKFEDTDDDPDTDESGFDTDSKLSTGRKAKKKPKKLSKQMIAAEQAKEKLNIQKQAANAQEKVSGAITGLFGHLQETSKDKLAAEQLERNRSYKIEMAKISIQERDQARKDLELALNQNRQDREMYERHLESDKPTVASMAMAQMLELSKAAAALAASLSRLANHNADVE